MLKTRSLDEAVDFRGQRLRVHGKPMTLTGLSVLHALPSKRCGSGHLLVGLHG